MYAYDSNDRLMPETKTTSTGSQVLTGYTWDANGNLATKTVGTGVMVYLWNGDNRLVEVKQGSSVATALTRARYGYDARGNRVSRTELGVDGQPDKVTTYLVDGTFAYAQTVQENVTAGSAKASTSYVWGAALIEQVRGDQTMFYHADGLGSVKALSDEGGIAKDAYEYDAFGTVESHTGPSENGYRYTGEYFDDQIGLQYNRARWLDFPVGRFVSIDSFEGELDAPSSLHRYSYAGNDSVNSTDPSGETSMAETGAATDINSTLGSTVTPSFQTIARKFLIGDPKNGDFGLIGDLVLDACMGAVDNAILSSKGQKISKQSKGVLAHTLLQREMEILNSWLAKGSLTRNVSIQAEISMDGGSPSKRTRYGAAGSYRLDVVVSYRGRAAVAFDLKTGKKVQSGIGTGGVPNWKRIEYQRRFRTRMYTVGVAIP